MADGWVKIILILNLCDRLVILIEYLISYKFYTLYD